MIAKAHPDLKYLKLQNFVGLRERTLVKSIIKNTFIKNKNFFVSFKQRLTSTARLRIRRTSQYQTYYVPRKSFQNWKTLIWTSGFNYFSQNNKFWTSGVGFGGSQFYWSALANYKSYKFFFTNLPKLVFFFKTIKSQGAAFFQVEAPLQVAYITGLQGAHKYSRSPGVFSIFKFQVRALFYSLVFLPSNQKKIFSSSSFFFNGRMWGTFLRNFRNSKAGFWQNKGHKVRVRGIAKNPVDHPHGGRTNTVKKMVSPWGWITKKK